MSFRGRHSWIDDVGQIHPQQGQKISTQAAVRIGTWQCGLG